jgi:hypothetical protein
MGDVYRAVDTRLARRSPQVLPKHLAEDSQFVDRFERSALLLHYPTQTSSPFLMWKGSKLHLCGDGNAGRRDAGPHGTVASRLEKPSK